MNRQGDTHDVGPTVDSPGSPRLPDTDRPDDELAAATARGETASFEALYARHAAVVHGIACQVLRDTAQAEDVTQEVWVEAWRTAARFDPARGSFRAWIVTMARRRAIDRVRALEAAGSRERRAAVADFRPDRDDVSESVHLLLEHQRVRSCLQALTDVQRQSVELAFYRGYTHREVSEALRVPLGTIKTRLRDGLIRLRDCIGVV